MGGSRLIGKGSDLQKQERRDVLCRYVRGEMFANRVARWQRNQVELNRQQRQLESAFDPL